jgi:hypothetical protein
VDDNYNFNIPKWVNTNYPKTLVYDDAQVNVLKKTLPLEMNNRSKGIKRDRKNLECRSYDF